MPYNSSRKAREYRLRAKYRKKTAVTAIVTLIVGLIVGFVLCVLSVHRVDSVSRLLKIAPVSGENPEEVMLTPTPTPEADSALEASDGTEPILTFNQSEAQPANAAGLDDGLEGAQTSDVDSFADDENAVTTFNAEDTDNFGDSVDSTDANPEAASQETNASGETIDAGNPVQIVPLQDVTSAEPETTPEPTVAPTAEATPEPLIIPFGQPCFIEAQINADGSMRTEVTDDPYETLTLTLQVVDYKDPAYFQEQYASQYKLQGDEAAVEFNISLFDYEGSTEIIPQNFLLITFVGSDPTVSVQGYQLMDSEIGGKTDVAIKSNETTTLYKRYPYSAEQGEMMYMAVTYYYEGEENVCWLEIHKPDNWEELVASGEVQYVDAAATPKPDNVQTFNLDGTEVTVTTETVDPDSMPDGIYVDDEFMGELSLEDGIDINGQHISYEDLVNGNAVSEEKETSTSTESEGTVLTKGSQGEEVSRLQQVLINLGLLKGSPDGKFGNYTAEAVRTMQARYGMEQTGVADQAFLDRLYAENP